MKFAVQVGWQRLTEALCDFYVETQRPQIKTDTTGLVRFVSMKKKPVEITPSLSTTSSPHTCTKEPLILAFCFSGNDPDSKDVLFVPEKGHTPPCETSQVCWAARPGHTSFLFSKTTGKASLHENVSWGAATTGKSAGRKKADGEGVPWRWRGW